MSNFDACVAYVLSHEGGLTQDKRDPGGTTNMGISLRFLREVHSDVLKRIGIFEPVTQQSIIQLTKEQAERLYYSEFWAKLPFEKIQNCILAQYIFDMAVNHGDIDAIKITQRACCAVYKNKDYLKEDGILGAKTLQAINQASFSLMPALIAQRSGYYRQLVAVNPSLEVFSQGWLERAFDISF